ncbi:MAG: alpha/beta hydrolase [Pseudomonadota bacterium]
MRQDVEITCRSEIDPSGILKNARAENRFHLLRSPRRVILVHGFNTGEGTAFLNFKKFREQAQTVQEKFEEDMFGFTWLGDEKPFIRWHRYFKKNTKNAEKCAEPFARFLDQNLSYRKNNYEIILIAHSLGCYLVLETMRQLVNRNSDHCHRIKVFFMAAAFPEDLLETGRTHNFALSQADTRLQFYSSSDTILKRLFQAGHFWFVEPAAGLNGMPMNEVWTTPPIEARHFKHDHYWEDREGLVCANIAKAAGYRGVAKPLPFGRAEIEERNFGLTDWFRERVIGWC